MNPIVLIRLLALLALLLAWPAFGAESKYGGCFADGRLCAGPSATVTLGQLNLSTGKFSAGTLPGIGYGLVLNPDRWYSAGVGLYENLQIGQGEPNHAITSFVFSFAEFIRLGLAIGAFETDGPVRTDLRLLFGLGADIGLGEGKSQ
jgi:hypothetical protein